MAKVGRQGMARQNKAVGEADRHRPCSNNSRQMDDRHRPCSKQPADDPTGTGLAVKQPADERPAQAL